MRWHDKAQFSEERFLHAADHDICKYPTEAVEDLNFKVMLFKWMKTRLANKVTWDLGWDFISLNLQGETHFYVKENVLVN